MRVRKGMASSILIGLMILAGLGLLAYPTVSNLWNDLHQSRAVQSYEDAVQQYSPEDHSRIWEQVRAYNEMLIPRGMDRFVPYPEESALYWSLLDVTGTGIMAYIEIPKLSVKLPLYHGTDDAVLQVAIGHIEGSSLPSGEPGTHTAVSGHTGLPSAKLFTHLSEMEIGDIFTIHVLDRVLTYSVDQIETVLPEEMDLLAIQEDACYCTLITCTPYGVNSHRLLVRGSLVSSDTSD